MSRHDNFIRETKSLSIEGEGKLVLDAILEMFAHVAVKARSEGADAEVMMTSVLLEALRIGAVQHEFVEGLLDRVYADVEHGWREGSESFVATYNSLIARKLSDADPVKM